jgi:hypothetical protein
MHCSHTVMMFARRLSRGGLLGIDLNGKIAICKLAVEQRPAAAQSQAAGEPLFRRRSYRCGRFVRRVSSWSDERSSGLPRCAPCRRAATHEQARGRQHAAMGHIIPGCGMCTQREARTSRASTPSPSCSDREAASRSRCSMLIRMLGIMLVICCRPAHTQQIPPCLFAMSKKGSWNAPGRRTLIDLGKREVEAEPVHLASEPYEEESVFIPNKRAVPVMALARAATPPTAVPNSPAATAAVEAAPALGSSSCTALAA